jgi:hypothetical protein
MAKEKQKKELNPEQFNEFLVEVATKVEIPTGLEAIKGIFTGEPIKDAIDLIREDNPLIKGYKATGSGYINRIFNDDTDFLFTDKDKKLLLEVAAFGDPDPKSGFRLNDDDPRIAKLMEENAKKLADAKPNMSNAEYEVYRANLRKDLVADVLKTGVTQKIYEDTPPKLDFYTRDKSKPFSDFITKELQMQSGLGFNPDIPDYAGGVVGYEYIPSPDQERFRTRTITSEVYEPIIERRDRLDSFSAPDKTTGLRQGPEGIFYNPQTEQFLRQKEVYGPPPTLQGYQYDPRLRGILEQAVNPSYASQFNKGGKTMNIKEQTKNVAAQGRFGDSMLLHVNPAEVKGLAQAMPITINPQTGQPEAFLPFLAPIFGSLAGSALASSTLVPALAGKTLLASALGSGLAQYAVTGDLKKGLLAGLTGYGIGKALNVAGSQPGITKAVESATEGAKQVGFDTVQALSQDPNNLTQVFKNVPAGGEGAVVLNPSQVGVNASGLPTGTVDRMIAAQGGYTPAGQLIADQTVSSLAPGISQAGKQAAIDYAKGNPNAFTSLKDAFASGPIDGLSNLATGFASPQAFVPISVGAGGTSIMESEEQFEEDLRRMAFENEERRRKMFEDNPENIPIPIATGGVMKLAKGTTSQMRDAQEDAQAAYERATTGNIRVQQRQGIPIEENFMAGFMPERGYFRGLNPSFTEITDTGESIQVDPLEEYNRRVIAPITRRPFDPTQTRQYQEYYGPQARNIIPTQVNPYAPVEFASRTPERAPVMPVPRPPTDIETTPIGDDDIQDDAPETRDIGDAYLPPIGPNPKGAPQAVQPRGDLMFNEDFVNTQFVNELPMIVSPIQDPRDFPLEKSDGKKTTTADYDVNELPENLKKMHESGPKGREGVAKIAAKTDKFQEGTQTSVPSDNANQMAQIAQDKLTARLVAFLRGEIQDDTIVGKFVDKYGNDTFLQIREMILQQIVPASETTGQIKNGNDAGGMADNIYGKIGAEQGVAVSQDEYIIPADVMSMLGDGSSDAGAKKLDQMLDRVRLEKTGTTRQAKPINEAQVMPA